MTSTQVERVGPAFVKLAQIMAELRGEQGCPWDRAQTHASLRRYVLEEAYEVAGAIDQLESDPGQLQEELGDLLLQVLFHAQLASEEGLFDLADVAETLQHKLIRRHPHVFGAPTDTDTDTDTAAPDAHPVPTTTDTARPSAVAPDTPTDVASVNRMWAQVKRRERGEAGFADLSRGLPALVRASQVMRRAAEYGFTWRDVAEGLAKVEEEVAEIEEVLAAPESEAGRGSDAGQSSDAGEETDSDQGGDGQRFTEELGDLLIATANLARLAGVDPEWALHRAVDKFIARFGSMQQVAAAQGQHLADANLDQQLRWWQQAKRQTEPLAKSTPPPRPMPTPTSMPTPTPKPMSTPKPTPKLV